MPAKDDDRSLEGWARVIERSGEESRPRELIPTGGNPAIPDGVIGTRKVQGVPSLTVFQWNAVVDVLTAEELSATPNEAALSARNELRQYLVDAGLRRAEFA